MSLQEERAYHLNPPAYRIDGKRIYTYKQNDNEYSDDKIRVILTRSFDDENTENIEAIFTNISNDEIVFQPYLEAETEFVANHYLIPCVSYNGNQWGKGNEPKGLTHDGQSWIFSYERTGIPACTLTENDDIVFAMLLPLPKVGEKGQKASCSLVKNEDGSYLHRIYFPIIEEPLTYTMRDKYSEESEGYIILCPGESFKANVLLWQSKPYKKNFGVAELENMLLSRYPRKVKATKTSQEIWRLGISFAKNLIRTYDGHKFITIGLQLNEMKEFEAVRTNYEFGWCGQNGLFSRMLITDYIRTGNKDSLETALSCLDGFAENALRESGLMCVHYESLYQGSPAVVDTCNLGFAIMEFAKNYRLLREISINKPVYLFAAKQIGNFMIRNYSPEYGFGKAWNAETGELVDPSGTVGAYIIPGLLELYRTTGDIKYLVAAEKALDFYYKRDLAEFTCTAGALDTNCIDKETSGSLFMSGVMLYESTKRKKFLEIAEAAAYYFSSWLFYYDVDYDSDTDFVRYGYHTLGATSVSTQHHHLDPWGGFMIPWFLKLADFTGNKLWRKRAEMIWCSITELVADEEQNSFHSIKRPLGAQNEGCFNCRWGNDFGEDGSPKAGMINDWLVAWPGAFRLNTIAEVKDNNFFEEAMK